MVPASAGRGSWSRRRQRGVVSSGAGPILDDVDLGGLHGQGLDDERRAPRELLQSSGQLVGRVADPRGQAQRHGERLAVEPSRPGGVAPGTAGEVVEHAVGGSRDEQQSTVAQPSAGVVLDALQGSPGETAPGPAEADPHALRVGDEEGRARVDESGGVHPCDAGHQHGQRPVERRARADGAGQVRRADPGRDQRDRCVHSSVATHHDGLRRDRQRPGAGGLGVEAVRRGVLVCLCGPHP